MEVVARLLVRSTMWRATLGALTGRTHSALFGDLPEDLPGHPVGDGERRLVAAEAALLLGLRCFEDSSLMLILCAHHLSAILHICEIC